MKKFFSEFLQRGLMSFGFGPVVLAIIYYILGQTSVLVTLDVNEVCIGIVSLSILAFIAGGMNAIYQIEQLPLMFSILIHGSVLYICYFATYLLNNWLDWGLVPFSAFTAIFIIGYILIWLIIYSVMKRNTAILNEGLKKKQEKE